MDAGQEFMPRSAIRRLISPRSIAVIGASERSTWTHSVLTNLEEIGFSGSLHLVNPKGASVFGRTAWRSCADIGEDVDMAILLVPASALEEMIDDAARARAGAIVLLAAGFAEAGEIGEEMQERLVARCRSHDMVLLGPNCLGLMNIGEKSGTWTGGLPRLRAGGVAIVSQSGGMGQLFSDFAASQQFGVSHVVSTGNEAMLDTTAVAAELLEEDHVRAVAIFCETVREPPRFLAMARRAAELRKPVVMLKAGVSALSAEIARTHTASIVGDDGVIDAALRSAGVIRVRSLEDLIVTAALAAWTGPLPSGGLAVVSVSGGACEMVADTADAAGLAIPRLSDAAAAQVSARLPDFATPRNPLDMTGAGLSYDNLRSSLEILGGNEGVAAVGAIMDVPPPSKHAYMTEFFRGVADGLDASGNRGFHLRQTLYSLSEEEHALLSGAGIRFSVGGIDHAVRAVARIREWSDWLDRPREAPASAAPLALPDGGPWTEARSLEFLASHGVPVMPAKLARTADEAVAAADALGYPVVAKIVSEQILHKSDIGGVHLDLPDAAAVRTAFAQVVAAGAKVSGARLDGVLIAPMRKGGVELIVGAVRDPEWGVTLTVGLGGVFTELIGDAQTGLLPLSADELSRMLRRLKGARILEGARGRAPVDVAHLAQVLSEVGSLAMRLGPALESLEINPLWMDGARIEALDALITWRGA